MVRIQIDQRSRRLEADFRYRLGLDGAEAKYLDWNVELDARHGDGYRTRARVCREAAANSQQEGQQR
jgi:hypothetical protein